MDAWGTACDLGYFPTALLCSRYVHPCVGMRWLSPSSFGRLGWGAQGRNQDDDPMAKGVVSDAYLPNQLCYRSCYTKPTVGDMGIFLPCLGGGRMDLKQESSISKRKGIWEYLMGPLERTPQRHSDGGLGIITLRVPSLHMLAVISPETDLTNTKISQ